MDERKTAAAVAKNALATQEATAEQSKGVTLAQYLDKQKPAITSALPRNIDVDRFTRICMTVVRTNPRLLKCDPMSILAAVMQSAQLGLEPGSGLGEAYIIAYGNQAQFQMGYRGVAKLAHNSGDVTTIEARAVYDGDQFKVYLGTDPRIEHIPDATSRDFDSLTAVYAVATMHDGSKQFDYMTKEEIEAHRDHYSKAKGSDTPWGDKLSAVEMAKKTVVIRLAKMLPLSAEVSRAFASDGVVRHELSADMTMVPDAESESVEPSALGIVEVDDDGVVVEEAPKKGEKATTSDGSEVVIGEQEIAWPAEEAQK